ncbi:hypothetical protein GGS21DRAFT_169426 [Xylaria nigripes]|nr:hypothetical protein GGS21DRAFT_169426 [Xylaria nigripes]
MRYAIASQAICGAMTVTAMAMPANREANQEEKHHKLVDLSNFKSFPTLDPQHILDNANPAIRKMFGSGVFNDGPMDREGNWIGRPFHVLDELKDELREVSGGVGHVFDRVFDITQLGDVSRPSKFGQFGQFGQFGNFGHIGNGIPGGHQPQIMNPEKPRVPASNPVEHADPVPAPPANPATSVVIVTVTEFVQASSSASVATSSSVPTSSSAAAPSSSTDAATSSSSSDAATSSATEAATSSSSSDAATSSATEAATTSSAAEVTPTSVSEVATSSTSSTSSTSAAASSSAVVPVTASAGTCDHSNPNVRVEWSDYADSDRTAFVEAIKCLQDKPSAGPQYSGAQNRYEDLVSVHRELTGSIHQSAMFLVWHRLFLWVFEQMLRDECGFNRALPWFDETKHAGAFATSDVFTDDWFGPLPNKTADGQGTCITTGEFGNDTLHVGPGTANTDHCLSRAADETQTAQCNQDFTNSCLSQREYDQFRECFELGPHGYGHNGIGAVMAEVSSSVGDPFFFLHHGFVDHTYRIWQNAHPSRRLTIEGCADNASPCTPISMDTVVSVGGIRPDVTVADVLDTLNGTLCYRYDY